MEPYLILSDIHYHQWHQFATGASRFKLLLAETARAVINFGTSTRGRRVVVAGDVFHVRGSVDPEVLNGVVELFERLIERGFEFHIMAGNHDLAADEGSYFTSAISALSKIGCKCYSDDVAFIGNQTVMIPWIKDLTKLKETILATAEMLPHGLHETDLIIHAPVNGVIKGLPENGLDPEWLKKVGFNRVFAGHYHNHVDFGGGVFSIGALAHHTWGDVGSLAGHIVVKGEGSIDFITSSLPRFVELKYSDDIDLDTIKGNYVKATIASSDAKVLVDVRTWLKGKGALGIIVVPEPPKSTAGERVTTVKSGLSMQENLKAYMDAKGTSAAAQSIVFELLS